MAAHLFDRQTFEAEQCQRAHSSFAVETDCKGVANQQVFIVMQEATNSIRAVHLPGLFSLFPLQIHGHHPPGEVLHALMVGQLGLRLAIQLPYLRRERVLLLHLIGMIETGAGGVVSPVGEKGFAQQVLTGQAGLGL